MRRRTAWPREHALEGPLRAKHAGRTHAAPTPGEHLLETKTNTATSEEWAFQYDALGNLVTVGLPNGDLVEYLVDGAGRRVGKKKNGMLLKQWIYRDALKPVAELDGAGNLVAEFAYASKTNVPDYVVRGGATYRVVTDHLGSPRYAVNVANAADVAFTASYTSFGEMAGTGLDWVPFGFAGGWLDPQTGLTRFGARDYDPMVGRWVSKDPALWQGRSSNLYSYSSSDPVNSQDPNGEDPTYSACLLAASNGLNRCVDNCTSFGSFVRACFGAGPDPEDCASDCETELLLQLDLCLLTAPPRIEYDNSPPGPPPPPSPKRKRRVPRDRYASGD